MIAALKNLSDEKPRLQFCAPTGEGKAAPVSTFAGVIEAMASILFATLVGMAVAPHLAYRNICMLYLLAVVYVASRHDWFPSILSAFLALLAYEYFISPPQFSFFPLDVQALITFGIVMMLSIIISRRTMHIHRLAGSLEDQVNERTTELKLVNQELCEEVAQRMQNEQIQQKTLNELAVRNATLEHFAKLAVHDLREPLRTMVGYVNLLEKRHSEHLPQDVHEFVHRIRGGVERMERLIGGIGAIARLDSSTVEFQPASAGEVVQEAITNLSSEIESKRAGVLVSISVKPEIVFCDYRQLVHVFQNLIANALKFCDEEPQIVVDCSRLGSLLVFSVSDNGIGIEERYRDKLFKIFQRLHSRNDYPGTGLGLVLCKKIVELHGGEIWFESKPGMGSTFRFSIPVATVERN